MSLAGQQLEQPDPPPNWRIVAWDSRKEVLNERVYGLAGVAHQVARAVRLRASCIKIDRLPRSRVR